MNKLIKIIISILITILALFLIALILFLISIFLNWLSETNGTLYDIIAFSLIGMVILILGLSVFLCIFGMLKEKNKVKE